MNYLARLHKLYQRIENPYHKAIFYAICKKYQDYTQKRAETKNISKEELIENLIQQDLMAYTKDKKGNTKLPDDRKLRQAVRTLTRYGYPIIATSSTKGYCIADTPQEVYAPQKENKKRALMCLAVQKGYSTMQNFINGQTDFLDTIFEELDYDDDTTKQKD